MTSEQLDSAAIVQDDKGTRQLQVNCRTTADGDKRMSVLMEMATLDVQAINNLVENMSEEDVELQWQHYEDERTGKRSDPSGIDVANAILAAPYEEPEIITPETPKILDANGLPAGSVLAKDLEEKLAQ